MRLDKLEYAIKRVKDFHSRDAACLEFDLLDKLSADTRLIESVLIIEEQWEQDFELAASYERYLLVGKRMGYDVSNKGFDYLASSEFCDSLCKVTRYLEALIVLAEYDLEVD